MRAQSVYVLPCPCGAEVETHEPSGVCPNCGRELAVEEFAGKRFEAARAAGASA